MPSSLWQDPGFRRLWAAQTTSQLGEHSGLVILPLLAVLLYGVSAAELGVLRAAGQAPLLLALLAGWWVDRRRTRTVMALADLGRALALIAAAVLGFLGLPLLIVVAFVVGLLSVFFDVAYQASVVRLVGRDHLIPATSALEGSRSAAQMGGPALGGTLTSVLPGPLAAAASALFFAVSFGFLSRIRRPEPLPARGRRGLGVRFVAAHPLLRAICLASAAFQFFLAAFMTGYLLFLPRELGLSGAQIGLVLAATGPGALIGSGLAARLRSGRMLVTAAVIGDGVLLLVPAVHGGGPVALVAINLVFGTFGQLVNVLVMAVRQSVTPDAMQGRVAATITFAGMGMAPFGSLLGGFLAANGDLRTTLVITAAGTLLSPLVLLVSGVARAEAVSSPAAGQDRS